MARVLTEEERLRRNERSRQMYWLNHDAETARARSYRAANLEQERARQRARQRDPIEGPKLQAAKAASKRKPNGVASNRRSCRDYYARHKTEALVRRSRRQSRMGNAAGIDYTTAEHIAARVGLYGGRCYYCGAEANSVDHRIPIARGGSHWPANLVPACMPCNLSKGTKTEQEFRR